jgi:repressor LexA
LLSIIFIYTFAYTFYTMLLKLNEKDKKAYNLIRNKLIHEGRKPTLREINKVTGGKSPRSASLVLDRLIKIGLLKRYGDNIRLAEDPMINPASNSTVNVPLVGSISCGLPILAQENIETYIPVSITLAKKGSSYFLLRAVGDSMNQAGVNDGDILLIRQQSTAEIGQKVVALVNDEATVKIFERKGNTVILRPKSTNRIHKPIILTEDCLIQGIVLSILPSDIS